MPRNVAVGVGLMEFPFSGADAYWRWVDLCEAGGVDSIWQTDRLVSPQPFLECMSALAALAGRTRRIKFGVNVLSLAMRDAVLVARQCATIDFLSNGRLLPAFGIGSPLGPEWTALNLDPKTRGRKTDEGLEVIRLSVVARTRSISTACITSCRGASIAPKPVQPDLPMWIGGSSEAAIRRTARLGTGWQAGPETPAQASGGRRRDQAGRRRSGPHDRRRPLRRRHPVPLRLAGRPGARAAVRGLPQAHRARSEGLFRDRRRRGDRREDRRLRRGRRVEIHPAPVGPGRRRDHGADPPADRGGPAARRRPLAETSAAARGGGVSRLYSGLISTLRNLITPSFLLAPVPSCSAITPLACVLSWTSTVLTPLSTTTRCGPCAVIS